MSESQKNHSLRQRFQALKAEKEKLDAQRDILIELAMWNHVLFAAISQAMMERNSALKDRHIAFRAFLNLSSTEKDKVLWPLKQQEAIYKILEQETESEGTKWQDGLPVLRHISEYAQMAIPVLVAYVAAYNKIYANTIFRINEYRIFIKLIYDILIDPKKRNEKELQDWCEENLTPSRVLNVRDQIACPLNQTEVFLIETIQEQADMIVRVMRSLSSLSSTVNRFNQNRNHFHEKILDSWEVLKWWFRYWMSGKAIGDNQLQFVTWFIRQEPDKHWMEIKKASKS